MAAPPAAPQPRRQPPPPPPVATGGYATEDDFNGDDIRHHKLTYLFGIFVFFIPLLAARQGRLGKFYANQGLVFLLLHGILFGLYMIVNYFVPFPFDMLVFGTYIVLMIMVCVLMLVAIVNVVRDAKRDVPIIGKLRLIRG